MEQLRLRRVRVLWSVLRRKLQPFLTKNQYSWRVYTAAGFRQSHHLKVIGLNIWLEEQGEPGTAHLEVGFLVSVEFVRLDENNGGLKHQKGEYNLVKVETDNIPPPSVSKWYCY